jgi:hypothetical protein
MKPGHSSNRLAGQRENRHRVQLPVQHIETDEYDRRVSAISEPRAGSRAVQRIDFVDGEGEAVADGAR